ncbi:MAG: hypothetical protein E7639_04065 [Ruminococcaceae bacterium]|nr:hypothetical protein [Oscillospiraceae bacterium]
MTAYVEFLYEILKQFFGGFWKIISGIFTGLFSLVDVPSYAAIVDTYHEEFNVFAWILAILTLLIVVALVVALLLLVAVFIKKRIDNRKKLANSIALLEEVGKLNSQVIRLTKEKDRILALKTGSAEIPSSPYATSSDEGDGAEQKEGGSTSTVKGGESRFYKLSQVDLQYKDYDRNSELFDNEITLEEICERFRNYACSRMGLFYEIRVIRLFLAAFSSTRLIILQGISGTGKTSLPYAWGKFLENDTQIASVQPSWRDRSELFGYFNEFTKRFSETEVLKRMYEATYTDKVYLTILDEMNIARVEYYFAEMLSILEMPSRAEWIVDLVPSGWPSDPKHIVNGRFNLPENMWYVGTANNDDSTFAISDKVYDRAIPINIDSKGVKFEAPYTENLSLSYKHLENMFAQAKEKYRVGDESLEKITKLDDYVIEHFRLAFGNRIVKQLRDFVPVYVACGGTEVDGLDYVLTNKIFRKFEGLNLAFIRDEIDGLIAYLSELFGEENMQEAKAYLRRLKKLV